MQAQGRTSYYVAEDEFLEYDVEMGLARFFEQISVNAIKYDILKTEFRSLADYDTRAAF